MWDVLWTDPDRELVGEHRARKSKQRAQQSPSTRSSLSSDSPFSFLRNHGLKQINTSKANRTMSGASSKVASPSVSSPLSLGSRRESNLQGVQQQVDMSPELSCQDSIFSVYPESDPRTSHSLADGCGYDKSPIPILRQGSEDSCMSGALVEPLQLPPRMGVTSPISQPVTPPMSPKESDTIIVLNPHQGLVPCTRHLPRSDSLLKPSNMNAWKPPDEWIVDNTKEMQEKKPLGEEVILDVASLRQDIYRMGNTSFRDILTRLGKLSGRSIGDDDESEKKRWMLWALENIDSTPSREESAQVSEGDSPNMLALYESSATAAYLTASNPTINVHHLSVNPLTKDYSPSITPIHVPSVTSHLPIETSINKAFTILLPSLLPQTEIPDLLSNLATILKPGGALHLILIDPLPHPKTTGPLLRSLLEKHLLRPLRAHDICTQPTRHFPQWLGDAGLRGQGSAITITRFFAFPQQIVYDLGEVESESVIKAQIRSHVGRSLWQEVWGRWMTCEKGWWEDQIMVEECMEFGTVWEYRVIKGVKGS